MRWWITCLIRELPPLTVNALLAHACPTDHPVCRRPARQGAGRAKPVKMQRPTGRTILTGLARSAGLVPWSAADGTIRLHLSQQHTVDAALAIIPESECPNRWERFYRRSLTSSSLTPSP